MAVIPYMPVYVADYLGDTAHLATEEHGAYWLLITAYWQSGKALLAEPSRLAIITRMTNERWASVQQTIESFFIVENGMWVHKRIEAELAKVRDKSEKARAAGRASGASRKIGPIASIAQHPFNGRSADADRTLNHPDPESEKNESVPSEQEPARACEVKAFLSTVGTGRGGKVSAAAKRHVCGILHIADADPLEQIFERGWDGKTPSRDPDKHFVAAAPTLFENAPPAVKAACRPRANDDSRSEMPVPPRASPQLAASALARRERC